jgi:hypothetical protein
MTVKTDQELLYLIEVVAKEAFSIGVYCHESRWKIRQMLREQASEQGKYQMVFENETDMLRHSDETLKNAVERISNLLYLIEARTEELAVHS